jgi:hypothetical protein
MKNIKSLFMGLIAVLSIMMFSGCRDDAEVASYNLSKAADNFEVVRRVVFYNGITGDYILSVQGLCSVDDVLHKVSFTCKDASGKYVKHMLGRSDNVTYFSEQLSANEVSVYQYRITFKPDLIIPDINIRSALLDDVSNN